MGKTLYQPDTLLHLARKHIHTEIEISSIEDLDIVDVSGFSNINYKVSVKGDTCR